MKDFELMLFSLKATPVLKLSSPSYDIDDEIVALLTLFDHEVDRENRTVNIQNPQRNSGALRQRVHLLVDALKDIVRPIYGLKTFIDGLDDGEFFFVFPNASLETTRVMELSNKLTALNTNRSYEEISAPFRELFGAMLDNYNLKSFSGNKQIKVGEADKRHRVCRFCRKSSPAVSFSKKAHAISEALGNKSIIANEECNSCNERFGEGIETDLIHFFDIFRTFLGIKGKGGSPKLKGVDFGVHKEPSGEVHLSFETGESRPGQPSSFVATTHENIVVQNVYKTLCKFVLSVVDSGELPKLGQTVAWINGDKLCAQLPKIFMMVKDREMVEQPSINVYLRKTDNKALPHVVGELQFACFVIVFLVPFSTEDGRDFLTGEQIQEFWALSPFGSRALRDRWRTFDLSDNNKRGLVFNIKFEERPATP